MKFTFKFITIKKINPLKVGKIKTLHISKIPGPMILRHCEDYVKQYLQSLDNIVAYLLTH